ncbi:hypothetical protein F0225_07900 [Vibrio pectenicida]|uniref:Uncharacterized protein n=1 Tax=Vibrio pectenicida TaxID=62763 RepID=A0A7Y3ZZC4_9VIBR|nr:hypothetical protein [Vibrio pectenicida]
MKAEQFLVDYFLLKLSARENIALLLSEGKSWSQGQDLLGCSHSKVAKVKKLTKISTRHFLTRKCPKAS